jgi:hypothetical protein
MTGPEHYAEAERLLALADRHTRPFTLMASRFTKSALLAGRQAQIPDLPGAGKSRSGETADGPCLRVSRDGVLGESGSGNACRASAILARAQRRDVRPNIWASRRSDSGLPACTLSRYAATAASLTALSSETLSSRCPLAGIGDCPARRPAGRHTEPDVPGRSPSTAEAETGRRAARQAAPVQRCAVDGPRSAAPQVRMSQSRSSCEPTRLTAGQAAITAPTGPWDQPCAMFAVRVAAMPSASSQRAREGTGTRCRAAYSTTIELA